MEKMHTDVRVERVNVSFATLLLQVVCLSFVFLFVCFFVYFSLDPLKIDVH